MAEPTIKEQKDTALKAKTDIDAILAKHKSVLERNKASLDAFGINRGFADYTSTIGTISKAIDVEKNEPAARASVVVYHDTARETRDRIGELIAVIEKTQEKGKDAPSGGQPGRGIGVPQPAANNDAGLDLLKALREIDGVMKRGISTMDSKGMTDPLSGRALKDGNAVEEYATVALRYYGNKQARRAPGNGINLSDASSAAGGIADENGVVNQANVTTFITAIDTANTATAEKVKVLTQQRNAHQDMLNKADTPLTKKTAQELLNASESALDATIDLKTALGNIKARVRGGVKPETPKKEEEKPKDEKPKDEKPEEKKPEDKKPEEPGIVRMRAGIQLTGVLDLTPEHLDANDMPPNFGTDKMKDDYQRKFKKLEEMADALTKKDTAPTAKDVDAFHAEMSDVRKDLNRLVIEKGKDIPEKGIRSPEQNAALKDIEAAKKLLKRLDKAKETTEKNDELRDKNPEKRVSMLSIPQGDRALFAALNFSTNLGEGAGYVPGSGKPRELG